MFQTNLRSQEKCGKKRPESCPTFVSRPILPKKTVGYEASMKNHHFNPKNNIASIGLAKRLLTSTYCIQKKIQVFNKQRFFSVKKNHRHSIGFRFPWAVFLQVFCFHPLTQPAPLVHPYQFVVHFLPATSHRPYSYEQAPPDIDFVFRFSSELRNQSAPPL